MISFFYLNPDSRWTFGSQDLLKICMSERILKKGQLISKQNYEVIVSPKKRTKYCKDFCPNC